MRVANKWVVVGAAAAAVAGFASATAAGNTTRDIKLNDPIAVEEVAGQLAANNPGRYVQASADDSGQQQFGADHSPGSPDSPSSTADSPSSTADSPSSTADSPSSTADSPHTTADDHADSSD